MKINLLKRIAFKFFCRRLSVGKSMENETEIKLSAMSEEELRKEVIRLRKHNQDLTNIIKKRDGVGDNKKSRPFNFEGCRKRHILLWISYLGWSFEGFVTQTNTSGTVEDILFDALKKVRLVEDIKTANYSRCGRTDKGVSAFSQVIGVTVRSCQPYDHSPLVTPELPYCKMLNRILPRDMRAIAWKPAAESVSARFDCVNRTYKYFFPRAKLNIEAMQEGCTYIEGTHDFRNLCKMDVANAVTKFVRTIDFARIELLDIQRDLSDPAYDMFALTVQSGGFLYHQIRSIMHVLFLVGEGHEKPDVFKELLDVEKHPRKPQYQLAHELPLNLFQVEYPSDDHEWVFEEYSTKKLMGSFYSNWTLHACKTAMLRSMTKEVTRLNPSLHELNSNFLSNIPGGTYRPLLERQTCDSLEERLDQLVKKRKITVVEGEMNETIVRKVPKIKINISEEDDERMQDEATTENLKTRSAMIELYDKAIKAKSAENGKVLDDDIRDKPEVVSDKAENTESESALVIGDEATEPVREAME